MRRSGCLNVHRTEQGTFVVQGDVSDVFAPPSAFPARTTRSGSAQPPGTAAASLRYRRQQWGHPRSRDVRRKISGHSGCPAHQDLLVQDPWLDSF
ncbi:hypothetical protein CP977_33870 [Streptomyces cinereoruber]|uniref:Uncharacterized protein n=1 Tax=Streptomyces cinereoruber TaxID=67260 RepID=A0ABX6BPS5_9ACTN|nr:hypothetical protein CP977_00195 [Streptomyces cinereoruber]QEV36533.1 hypothetical protein CP977_33870 [Streptomyces cinereoruber]